MTMYMYSPGNKSYTALGSVRHSKNATHTTDMRLSNNYIVKRDKISINQSHSSTTNIAVKVLDPDCAGN